MKPETLPGVASVTFVVLLATGLSAQIRSSSYVDPEGQPHSYQAVEVVGGITHADAVVRAAAMGGYLATATTAAETSAVFRAADDPALWIQDGTTWLGPWIGGLQVEGASEPGGGWKWGELEEFAYTAWALGQPDDDAVADRMCLGGGPFRAGTWADVNGSRLLAGFVVEFAGPTALRTVGLRRQEPGSFQGYTLFSPLQSNATYLVDARGRLVKSWHSSSPPGACVYLEGNGHLLRSGQVGNPAFAGAGGDGGLVEELDWDGQRVWSFTHSTATEVLHHDVERLPDGNILMIVWEKISAADAIAAGRDPSLVPAGELWSEKIVEIEPTGASGGNIVWQWRVFDHLIQDVDPTKANHGVVADHPERIDVNYTTNAGGVDWLHFNSVAYNQQLDQVVVSSRAFSEIWILDHSTTTEQAAGRSGGRSGRGGDLLFRFGNPQAHRAGTEADRTLYWQHDPHWIPPHLPGAGHLLVFNNGGRDRPGGPHSTVDEYALPPVDIGGNYLRTGDRWEPDLVWRYVGNPPSSFDSQFVSGSQRLPNGNTMICAGWNGEVFEVTPSGQILCSYVNPIGLSGATAQGAAPTANMMFRAPVYPPEHPALRGRALAAGDPLEWQRSVLLADGSTVPLAVSLGDVVRLDVRAETHPGLGYVVLASATEGLTPVDDRMLRIAFDSVTSVAAAGLAPSVFGNFQGLLDAGGRATATLAIPWLSVFRGLTFLHAFVVVDEHAPTGVALVSNTVSVTIR
ncbi:MAG: aryl-sulfate sulfotransferase [Planctomycetota bacterium]